MNREKMKGSIDSIISLTDEEWQQIASFIEVKTLKKNNYILREGQVCEFVAYIDSGSLIYFKLLDSGEEITTDFAFEGDWISDNHSRLNHSPSFINIKTIEATRLAIIKNTDLAVLYSTIPKLEKLGRILIEQAFIKIAQLSMDLQSLSAKDRYIKLLRQNPEIFKKMPLYHIANYLGVAPKSLSRIRNEIHTKP